MSRSGYQAVIGIEIHVQLNTESKVFCSDPTNFSAGDNENTSPYSVGMPGTLPTLNKKAVEYSIKTGLALGCQIREESIFSRKNYFYPDLPKGYQISQYDKPLCENGQVSFRVNGVEKVVSITRAHIEEDAGKSTHLGDQTLLNYNRAGIPLLEVVSGPDMHSPAEAAEYARTVRQIVRYLGVCDGNLEEGSLRCDCNVSVRKQGDSQLGTKVELKNINSFRFVEKSIEYEIERQIDCLERGEKILQETRMWDPDKNKTYTMRAKEDAQDYRYFPDPDLLPLVVTQQMVDDFRKDLPELPRPRALRFQAELGLPESDAQTLTAEKSFADYFEQCLVVSKNPKATANWIMTELVRELNDLRIDIRQSPISPQSLGRLIELIDRGQISGKIAKSIFQEMWKTKNEPETIIKEKGLAQISDPLVRGEIIDGVLSQNSKAVVDYKSGKSTLFGFFVGAVMKASRGQANPEAVNRILLEKLKL